MKYFNKCWDSFRELLGEDMVKHRKNVLAKVLYTINVIVCRISYTSIGTKCTSHLQVEEQSDLQKLLSITDLLASCAEGENLFVESTCQTIYKVRILQYRYAYIYVCQSIMVLITGNIALKHK